MNKIESENQKIVCGFPGPWRMRETNLPLCPGCQHGVIGRVIGEVLDEMGLAGKAIAAWGAGCSAILPLGLDIDQAGGMHGRPVDIATGIKRVHPEALVFTIQGDGDCIAIGADALFGAVARAEKITVIMANNVNYGSTGGQLAPTTLMGQVTPTSPEGRMPESGYPLHIPEMLALTKSVAYSARGALNTPANFQKSKKYVKNAFQKQLENVGLSFVEIISACPTCWHLSPVDCMEYIEEKIIVEFPLGEFKKVDSLDTVSN